MYPESTTAVAIRQVSSVAAPQTNTVPSSVATKTPLPTTLANIGLWLIGGAALGIVTQVNAETNFARGALSITALIGAGAIVTAIQNHLERARRADEDAGIAERLEDARSTAITAHLEWERARDAARRPHVLPCIAVQTDYALEPIAVVAPHPLDAMQGAALKVALRSAWIVWIEYQGATFTDHDQQALERNTTRALWQVQRNPA